MKEYGNQLYSAMQEEISAYTKKGLKFTEEIEGCFLVAVSYWTRLQEVVGSYIFSGAGDEIDFYKRIKPLFVSEIEYDCLVYSSELFRPPDLAGDELKTYWLKEALRLKRFRKENQGFYVYYKSSQTYMDEQYFLRAYCEERFLPETNLYKRLDGDSSSHDHLVCTLLALERYQAYVKKKVKSVRAAL